MFRLPVQKLPSALLSSDSLSASELSSLLGDYAYSSFSLPLYITLNILNSALFVKKYISMG